MKRLLLIISLLILSIGFSQHPYLWTAVGILITPIIAIIILVAFFPKIHE